MKVISGRVMSSSYGAKIAGVSAILLFIVMFYDWFGVEFSNQSNLLFYLRGTTPGRNAWEALDYIPIVLLIAIVAALSAAAVRLFDIIFKPPTAIDAIVGILGSVSAWLILYRIFRPPDFGTTESLTYEATLQFPIFLGLFAAMGIAFGGLLATWEEGITPSSLRAGRYRVRVTA